MQVLVMRAKGKKGKTKCKEKMRELRKSNI
jgi:hypothetical protein